MMDQKYLTEIKARCDEGRPTARIDVKALIAEVERLTAENTTLDTEVDKWMKLEAEKESLCRKLEKEYATLKKAYELACECLAKNIPLCQNGAMFYGWRDKKEFIDRFMQQVQQTHETQEAEK